MANATTEWFDSDRITPRNLRLIDRGDSSYSLAVNAGLSRDAFNRLRVSEPQYIFSSAGTYDDEPLIWQSVTSSGAANHNSNTRGVDMTLSAADGYVVRQTYRYFPYEPGRSQFITMTGTLGDASTNVTKRIGQFDSANGVFFQQSGDGTLSVVRRSSTSGSVADDPVAQAEWNLDKLDGTGDSSATLDPTNDQIWTIDYGWLGTATVRFGIYIDGHIVYCHAMHHANVLSASYMQSATLPLRYEIAASGAITGAPTLTQFCSGIASEGGYFQRPGYEFSAGRSTPIDVSAAECLVAIRPATTFNSLVNRIWIEAIGIVAFASSAPVEWRVYYYPPGTANPVTGGTWAVVNTASGVEVNTSGTAISTTGGYEIARGIIGADATGNSRGAMNSRVGQLLPLTLDASGASSPLASNTGANPAYLALYAIALSGSPTAAGSMTWTEIR
jgi:hypothetical protein